MKKKIINMAKDTLKKKAFPVQFLLWALALSCMAFSFFHYLEPVTVQETLNAADTTDTPPLLPGDCIKQSFRASKDSLLGVEIAFSYNESLSDSVQAIVQLFRGDELIMEQPLTLIFNSNDSFLYFDVKAKDCLGETFTISVQNITETAGASLNPSTKDACAFSLMATDKELLYLDNMDDYQINSTSYSERLLCRFTYQDGYSFYFGLSVAFIIFLLALLASSFIGKHLR